jgi:hypothetical protein
VLGIVLDLADAAAIGLIETALHRISDPVGEDRATRTWRAARPTV